MRCILCDRCKKIVENEKKMRMITCARPIAHPKPDAPPVAYRGDDRKMNDIIWMKELCMSCAEELEEFMEPIASTPTTPPDPSEPSS